MEELEEMVKELSIVELAELLKIVSTRLVEECYGVWPESRRY